MIYELSVKNKVEFFITDEWLNVDEEIRYIGHPSELIYNETMCGLIVDPFGDAFKDYVNKGKSIGAIQSFKSLLSSLNIHENDYKTQQIYKRHLVG